ncbi:unnamed protein product [Rotaria sp. Silwood2]|nr:unnamed protein product [Rotaria sp. Silwood2]
MVKISSSNIQRTSANPSAADRNIRKDEKECRYEQLLPPYYPCKSHVIHFINSATTEEELKILCNVIQCTTDFIFDTESDIHSHTPAHIQILLVQQHSEYFLILLIETTHLPDISSSRFREIQNLFYHLFRSGTNLYSWGSFKDELTQFEIYQLYSLSIPSRIFDIQRLFTRWFDEYIHIKSDDKNNNTINYDDSIFIHAPALDPELFLPPAMMNHLKVMNNKLWSLQDAIAYLFYKYLSKRDTLRSWPIGLDKRLSSRNKNYSFNYRRRLIQYASYDCLSLMEIILFIHENYLSHLHDNDSHIQSLGEYFFYLTTKFSPSPSSFQLVNNSQMYELLFDDESDESMTGDELYERHQISSEAQTDEQNLNIFLPPVEPQPSEQIDQIQQEINCYMSNDQCLRIDPQSNNYEYDIDINSSEESNHYHQELERNYHAQTNNFDVISSALNKTKRKRTRSESARKRRRQHATTKLSPYQLQFGRIPTLPPDIPRRSYEFLKPNDYFHYFKQTLNIYHQYAIMNIKQQQKNYKKYFDHNRPDVHYSIADIVLKRISTNRSKLAAIYSNPMKVIKESHPTYLIQDLDDQRIYQVHVSQLRSINCDRFHL